MEADAVGNAPGRERVEGSLVGLQPRQAKRQACDREAGADHGNEVVSRRDGLGEPRQPAVRPRHQQVADRQPEANTFVSKAEVRLGVRSVELVGQRGVIRRFQGQVEAGDERLDDVFEMRTARR